MEVTHWMAIALGASLVLNMLQYGIWRRYVVGTMQCTACRQKRREALGG